MDGSKLVSPMDLTDEEKRIILEARKERLKTEWRPKDVKEISDDYKILAFNRLYNMVSADIVRAIDNKTMIDSDLAHYVFEVVEGWIDEKLYEKLEVMGINSP